MVEILTPCYVIDVERFKNNLIMFQKAFSSQWNGKIVFGYSIKTNHEPWLLKLANEYGMYAETVSDDEYHAAILSGYMSDKIIFNGPQKSSALLIEAIQSKGIVNLDNDDELKTICEKKVPVERVTAEIGLRVNFDLEYLCPGETTAGEQVSRFGFCVENGDFASAINKLHALGIPVSGLHMHYSTKSRSERVFRALACEAARLISEYHLQDEIKYIDMGGGFFFGNNVFSEGKPTLELYAEVITTELKKVVSPTKVTLILEPGASLISTAVEYYTKIINQRMIRGTKILTVDGSNLHINPFMAHRNTIFEIQSSNMEHRKLLSKQVVCGATCMENDRIAYLNNKKELFKDDVIVCHCAGAYTMGFNSCFINLPPYIFIKKNNRIQLIRNKNKQLMLKI